ncbi:TFIIH subunit TTDA/Tfb5 like protein [Aduncisulcus paluster]|uniref:General transcription and DNA repair factor IIH subunit TFB5 n=1 Tax=Aduncisulcus paluster TaxID=2918883 RepID=A0ABQ5KJY2_9EUKA|nr:TFIIH subunit TTDA/Tfb5 like protein [Aduncisulcus paluster]
MDYPIIRGSYIESDPSIVCYIKKHNPDAIIKELDDSHIMIKPECYEEIQSIVTQMITRKQKTRKVK